MEFIGTPTTGGKGTTVATIDSSVKTNGNVEAAVERLVSGIK